MAVQTSVTLLIILKRIVSLIPLMIFLSKAVKKLEFLILLKGKLERLDALDMCLMFIKIKLLLKNFNKLLIVRKICCLDKVHKD